MGILFRIPATPQAETYWLEYMYDTNLQDSNVFESEGIAPGSLTLSGTWSESSFGGTNLAAGLFKIANPGGFTWQKRTIDRADLRGSDVATDASGNICQTGFYHTGTNGIGWAQHVSVTGVQTWEKSFSYGTDEAAVTSSAFDTSNNMYLTMFTSGGVLMKMTTGGTETWQRRLGELFVENGLVVTFEDVDVSGTSVVAVGSALSLAVAENISVVAKYDSTGSLVWVRSLEKAGELVIANSVSVDVSGNIYIAGTRTESTSSLYTYAFVAKYDTSGTLLWQRKIGNDVNAYRDASITHMTIDSSGNIYSQGYHTHRENSGGDEAYGFLMKHDTDGNLIWQRKVEQSWITVGSGIDVLSPTALIVSFRDFDSAEVNGGNLYGVIPTNGTGTATYGIFSYASVSVNDVAGDLVSGTPSLADAAGATTVTSLNGGVVNISAPAFTHYDLAFA